MKHITLALLAIACLFGAVEVGLRVHHSWTIQARDANLDFQSLSTPSWKCHHALKPLKSTIRRNPDTKLPVSIRTNSLGLRGEAVLIPKSRDVFRIVFLGDEAVFASEVEEADTFCKLLAQDLKNISSRRCEVINAGVPGYCPLLSYLQFKHSLCCLQPDLLILNLDMSDMADDHHYRRHARLGTAGTPLLCAHPSLQPAADGSARSAGHDLLLLQVLKRQLGLLPADETRASDQAELETTLGRYAWTRESRPDWQVYIAQALAPIGDLRELANQLSCPLVVTLSPAPWQVSARAMPDPAARQRWGIAPGKVYDASLATGPVMQILDANSIPYFDPTGPFQEADRPEALFHETVPRFSRRGHALFARVVSSYLKKSNLLRKSPLPQPRSGGST